VCRSIRTLLRVPRSTCCFAVLWRKRHRAKSPGRS
jgi:hypothetical protein